MRVPVARTIKPLFRRPAKTLATLASALTGRGRREAIRRRLRRRPEGWSDDGTGNSPPQDLDDDLPGR